MSARWHPEILLVSLYGIGQLWPPHKCADLFSPVFNLEILDATELIGVVGHEREFQTTGVRRDEEIVRADHRSSRFERSADLGIVKGGFVGKVQNLDVSQVLIEGSMILLSFGRHFNPEQKL